MISRTWFKALVVFGFLILKISLVRADEKKYSGYIQCLNDVEKLSRAVPFKIVSEMKKVPGTSVYVYPGSIDTKKGVYIVSESSMYFFEYDEFLLVSKASSSLGFGKRGDRFVARILLKNSKPFFLVVEDPAYDSNDEIKRNPEFYFPSTVVANYENKKRLNRSTASVDKETVQDSYVESSMQNSHHNASEADQYISLSKDLIGKELSDQAKEHSFVYGYVYDHLQQVVDRYRSPASGTKTKFSKESLAYPANVLRGCAKSVPDRKLRDFLYDKISSSF